MDEKNLYRVAVIGSGPSGFFAAEELLAQTDPKIAVDLFDRLPTPFGLVRGGVAPDHQKIKSVTKIFEKTASRENFRFFGHVEFGKDLSLSELKKNYDAIIFAVGAKSDRKMNIPGEDLAGSHPATDFVAWYNGHPDYRNAQFDLSVESAAIVGNGNVAMDVTRILACDPSALENTDISDYALEALKKSRIKTLYVIGRRGPAQAAFTNPEIRELGHLAGTDLIVNPKELELDALSQAALAAGKLSPNAKNNLDILKEQSQKTLSASPKKIIMRFLLSPVELVGEQQKVKTMKVEKNILAQDADGSLRAKGSGQFETLSAGLVLRSVGYKGVPLADLPYDERKGTIPNLEGRIVDAEKNTLPQLYVVGWAKRGPTGIIGTNKPDSIETVKKLLEDLKNAPAKNIEASAMEHLLAQKKVRTVNFQAWQKLDALEIQLGHAKNKVREKFTTITEMLQQI